MYKKSIILLIFILFTLISQSAISSKADLNQNDYGMNSSIDLHTQVSLVSWSSSMVDTNHSKTNFNINFEIINPTHDNITTYAPCWSNWDFYLNITYIKDNSDTNSFSNKPATCATAIREYTFEPGIINRSTSYSLSFSSLTSVLYNHSLFIPIGTYIFEIDSLFYANIPIENHHQAYLTLGLINKTNSIQVSYDYYHVQSSGSINQSSITNTANFDSFTIFFSILVLMCFVRRKRNKC